MRAARPFGAGPRCHDGLLGVAGVLEHPGDGGGLAPGGEVGPQGGVVCTSTVTAPTVTVITGARPDRCCW